MATELQLKLFRSNPQFIYLAELMAQQIYPRLMSAMEKLGMAEVYCEKVEGWKRFSILIQGKIQFFTLSEQKLPIKSSIYELDFLGLKICPLFLDTGSSAEETESPFEKYEQFCESVISQVEILEKNFKKASALILKIENMGGFPLERKVITEKFKK